MLAPQTKWQKGKVASAQGTFTPRQKGGGMQKT